MSKHSGLFGPIRADDMLQPVWPALDAGLDAGAWAAGALSGADILGAQIILAAALPPPIGSDSWTATAGGDWSTASDWSTQAVPGTSTRATIAAAGTYTVSITSADAAASLLIDNANLQVSDTGTLSIGTTLTVAAGTFVLENGGSIVGGTIDDSAGNLIADGGTLSGVTYDGTLNLGSLTVLNGLTGASGTINLTAESSQLTLDNTQTLNNLTIDIGNEFADVIVCGEDNGLVPTLKFGSNVNIVQTGAAAVFDIENQGVWNFVINQGTITAGVSGGLFDIYEQAPDVSFANQGTLIATNGDIVALRGSSFLNDGSLSASNGGTLLIETSNFFFDGGSLSVSGDALVKIVSETNSLYQFSTTSGGVLELGGRLSNSGGMVTLDATAQLTLIAGGEIFEGIVSDSGGNLIAEGGTLSGVSYQGALNLSATGAALAVENGLTVSSGLVSLIGASAALTLEDTQTLNNMTIDIGNNMAGADIYLSPGISGASTITLGPQLDVIQVGSYAAIGTYAAIGGSTLLSEGLVSADVAGAALTISGEFFTNVGTLLATNGGTIDLRGTGTLTNIANGTLTAGTFEADAGSTLQLTNNQIVTTDAGTIILSGANSVLQSLKTASNGEVTVDGRLLTISSSGTLALLSGRNFAASGTFADDGRLELGGGTFRAISLTVGSGASMSGYGTVVSIGSGTVPSAIENSGTISAETGTLVLAGPVSGAGMLSAASGAVLDLSKGGTISGNITGAGEVELTAGLSLIAGASLSAATLLDTANLRLGTGENLTNAATATFALSAATGATITLSGAAGDSLTNAGTLTTVGNGAARIATAFVNSRTVAVSTGTLAFLGSVTNNGILDAGTGLLSVATTVSGTGTLDVSTAGTLSLLLGAGSGQTADFLGGAGLLELTNPLYFAGTIAGFGGGETIALTASAETSFTYAGGTLTIDDGTRHIATLRFSGSYTQADFSVTNSGGDVLVRFG